MDKPKEAYDICLEIAKSFKERLEETFSKENIKIGISKRLKIIEECLINNPHTNILKRKIVVDRKNSTIDVTDTVLVPVDFYIN